MNTRVMRFFYTINGLNSFYWSSFQYLWRLFITLIFFRFLFHQSLGIPFENLEQSSLNLLYSLMDAVMMRHRWTSQLWHPLPPIPFPLPLPFPFPPAYYHPLVSLFAFAFIFTFTFSFKFTSHILFIFYFLIFVLTVNHRDILMAPH